MVLRRRNPESTPPHYCRLHVHSQAYPGRSTPGAMQTDLVGVVDMLTLLQIDPTAAGAPSADLALVARSCRA